MWDIYSLIIIIIGLYALIFSSLNILFMYRNTRKATIIDGPLISILIPARDEESSIGACLRSLSSQSYKNIEILVLDDHSSDSTWDIINSYARKDVRIRALKGASLPDGWNGKNYALQQLSESAKGEYYLLTDADTEHSVDSVSFAYTNIIYHDTDMISGYPRQTAPSFSNLAVVTAMHFNILFINPLWIQKKSKNPLFGLAIGQYIFIRSSCLHDIGGFYPIRDSITDDIHLARNLLSHGYHQIFLDLGTVVSCNMFDSFSAALKGITRSVIDFFDKKIILPLFAVPIIIAFMIAPTFILFYEFFFSGILLIPVLLGVILFLLAWMQTMVFLRYSLKTILLFTPTMTLVVAMFLYGCFITMTGKGYIWKNRVVK